MPIIVPQNLPAQEILAEENVFVMNEAQAVHQDIRPLRIGIVNLMPLKSLTETQLIRQLSNFPVQVELILIKTETYTSTNTSWQHLESFYKTFDEVKDLKFDGMLITGAPVEMLRFGEVEYWPELEKIMAYTVEHVTSTFYICWAAQAALYYYYGIHNYLLPHKIFGVFKHQVKNKKNELVRGFDDEFWVPHSRYTENRREDVEKVPELEILAESDEAGLYLIASRNGRHIFVSGHSEYDYDTLRQEYLRDKEKGLSIQVPRNYFPQDDPAREPRVRWRSHANLLYGNWLNYYVYQATPFDWNT